MAYFKNFPKILYSLDKYPTSLTSVTNVFVRSNFLNEIKENTGVSYGYDVKDGDTAEILADKLYKDPQRHWIVLMFNNILNPYYEFPMTDKVFENFIINKYGSVITAQDTLKHHENVITKTNSFNGDVIYQTTETHYITEYSVDYTTGELTTQSLPTLNSGATIETTESHVLTDGSVLTIVSAIRAVSAYEYEVDLNESKRNKNFLDPKYTYAVENELQKLMGE
jgi:hypothetical protein